MKVVTEGNLKFSFLPERWSGIVKYDNQSESEYNEIKFAGITAVDIVAVKSENVLCFFEIKNITGFEEVYKDKLNFNGDILTNEIAKNVFDTIAGITVFSRNSTNNKSEEWKKYLNIILDKSNTLFVVLWLEGNLNKFKNFNVNLNILNKNLQRKFRKRVNIKTFVCNSQNNPFNEFLTVEYITN